MNDAASDDALTVAVHQATGMIAAQADCTVEEAFHRLRIRAAAMDQSVHDTALDVLDRRIRFYK
jgi:AmiR/NasT family two-component response regulator